MKTAKVINFHDVYINRALEEIAEKEFQIIEEKEEYKNLSEEGIYMICETILNEGITDEFLDDMKEMIRIFQEKNV